MANKTKTVGKIMVVDDDANIRLQMEEFLEKNGHEVLTFDNPNKAEAILSNALPNLILLDVKLGSFNGIEILSRWKTEFPTVPIVLISGDATADAVVKGIKAGAYDFISKPFQLDLLKNTIERGLEKNGLLESKERLDDQPNAIIGSSAMLNKQLKMAEKLGNSMISVLIFGESGTGKELMAKYLHDSGDRRDMKFVKINCAAIPDNLLEAELFGHTKGAFTGAHRARKGLFEFATGGTLFLDEIGELSPNSQAKVLRAIQQKEITPVGSNEVITIDVRIIAATNRDLKDRIKTGDFREDLYYRLNGANLIMPPLRERPDDIAELFHHFAANYCQEFGLPQKPLVAQAKEALESYPWPGNIRELQNAVERLMILAEGEIGLEDLPEDIYREYSLRQGAPINPTNIEVANQGSKPDTYSPITWNQYREISDRKFLTETLNYYNWNITETADSLGVKRITIYRWMNNLGINNEKKSS